MKKKFPLVTFAAGVLLCVVFCLFPSSISAQEMKTYGDYQYQYNEEYQGIEILKYQGTEAKVTVPDTIEGKPVTVIGERAFQKGSYYVYKSEKNETLEEVILPETVVNIKGRAFHACVNLKKVTLPNNLGEVGEYAFDCCFKLQEINLPESLTILSEALFGDCDALETIVIPANVKRIEDSVFSGCNNLKNVKFQKNSKLEYIGYEAFADGFSLKKITFEGNVPKIEKEAFLKVNSKAVFKVPKKYKAKYKKALMKKSVGYKKTMKVK